MSTKERILTEAVKLFSRDGFDAVTVEMIAEAVGIKAPSLYKHFRSKRDIFESILKEMERMDAENAAGAGMPLEPLENDCAATDSDVSQSAGSNHADSDSSQSVGSGHADSDSAQSVGKGLDSTADQYDDVSIPQLLDFCRKMFRYWTEDEFAASFRRMLTVEQYKSREMNELYHQYLGSGPLGYTADITGSEESALALYGPMFMLYSIYDSTYGKADASTCDKADASTTGKAYAGASSKTHSTIGGRPGHGNVSAYEMLNEHLDSWYKRFGKKQ